MYIFVVRVRETKGKPYAMKMTPCLIQFELNRKPWIHVQSKSKFMYTFTVRNGDKKRVRIDQYDP